MQTNKTQRSLIGIVAGVLLLAACTSNSATAPTSKAPQAGPTITTATSGLEATALLPNLVLLDTAEVAVKHPGGSDFVPVTLGAEVTLGDLIMVYAGNASIFCGDEAEWDSAPLELTTGQRNGVPCAVDGPPLSGPRTGWLRGESAVTSPLQVLSPRTGKVLSNRPNLAWQGVAGATSYTVTLKSDDGHERAAQLVDNTSISFPQTWAPIEGDGAEYSLFIEASNGITSDTVSGTGFYLLEPDNQVLLNAQTAHLYQRPLNETALALLLAHLYVGYSLRSEAIEMLTALPRAQDTAAVQQLLGDTYLEMGLPAQAEAAYTRLMQLAKEQKLGEVEAAVFYGLGHVACNRRQAAMAAEEWQKALSRYEQMGMQSRVLELESLLAEHEKRCG